MDAKVSKQLKVVHDLVDGVHSSLKGHIESARKAFAAKDEKAHESAMDAMGKLSAEFVAKKEATAKAIEEGAPTSSAA